MTRKKLRCPACGGQVSRENPFLPFCSERCRLLDLERWLNGKYRIPGPPVPESEIESDREE